MAPITRLRSVRDLVVPGEIPHCSPCGCGLPTAGDMEDSQADSGRQAHGLTRTRAAGE